MHVFTYMVHVYMCVNAYGGLMSMPVSTLIAFHISFELEYVTSLASLAGKCHSSNPISTAQCWGYRCVPSCPAVHVCVRDLYSGLCVHGRCFTH